MSEAKSKPSVKFSPKRSSSRPYSQGEAVTQKASRTPMPNAKPRRPKAEILRELQHLRSLPLPQEEEEEAEQEQKKEPVLPPAEPLRTMEALTPLCLTRHGIEQLLHCNSFDQVVRSCFVRVNINPGQVPAEHRLAEIVDVSELDEGYYVGKTATNIALSLRYDDLDTKHELNDISNMAFTSEEFDYWHDNCICQGFEWPTTELVGRKKIELYNARNSEGKITSLLKQNGLLPLSIPMRPVPRGGLLERLGGVYPWKLQRPTPVTLPPTQASISDSYAISYTGSDELGAPEPTPIAVSVQPPLSAGPAPDRK